MPKKKDHLRITPLQSIRRKCLWCCAGSHTEVRLCPAEGCPLWEYRLGKRPAQSHRTPVQAIKAKCRDCCGETWADVQKCPGQKLADGACPLFGFREGSNPNISAETRARQRAALERRRLVEKRQSSPLVATSETEGRVFVHPEGEGLGNAPFLFNPATAGNPAQVAR